MTALPPGGGTLAAGLHQPGNTLARFLIRLLTRPSRLIGQAGHLLLPALARHGPVIALAAAGAAAAGRAARAWLHRRQHLALAARARTVTVLAPPQADPAGGE